jgi:hypothetical protein
MIKIMIMVLCLSSNEATIVSESTTTEIGPNDRKKSEGYNYKKHYRKLSAWRMKRKNRGCSVRY